MAVLTMEDQFGRFEGVLFPGNANRRGEAQAGPYEKFGHDCEPDLVALFTGTVERRERRQNRPPPTADEGEVMPDGEEGGGAMVVDAPAPEELPSLRIANVVPAHLVIERLTREIVVAADAADAVDAATVKRLVSHTETAFKEHIGTCPVGLQVHTGGVMLTLALGERWKVHPSQELVGKLRAIWGADRVQVVQAGREALLPSDGGRAAAFAH
jgi:hypothetical protein